MALQNLIENVFAFYKAPETYTYPHSCHSPHAHSGTHDDLTVLWEADGHIESTGHHCENGLSTEQGYEKENLQPFSTQLAKEMYLLTIREYWIDWGTV